MGSSADIKTLQTAVAALTARVATLEKIVIPVVAPPVVVDPPPPPVDVPPVGAFKYPAGVVGLGWKVTLESGLDVAQPALASYKDDNFRVSDDGKGAQLRCHYGAGHTANSQNTRCEWREMSADGKSLASWSAKTGTHAMRAVFRANRLMDIRPHVVVGQIHDPKNDVTVWRIEGSSLWITKGNTTHAHLVTDDFTLGVDHTIEFHVAAGVVSYAYNGVQLDYTLKTSATGLYFRQGCYAQANGSTAPGGLTSDYSEIETRSLVVTHTS